MKNRTKDILIIDDNLDVRRMYEVKLSKYDLRYATDGLQGLAEIGLKKPDLVILDMNMPIMNGKEFLDKVEKDFPILVLANTDDENILNVDKVVRKIDVTAKGVTDLVDGMF